MPIITKKIYIMKKNNLFQYLIFVLIAGPFIAYSIYEYQHTDSAGSIWIAVVAFFVAILITSSIKIADQWEKAVVLRLGKFRAIKGPGIFFIIPIIDTLVYWIDLRIITTSFNAEKTLTKDTVPVDVEAVLFWKVNDPMKAALEVEDYKKAITWASQTALREVIGKSMLSEVLAGRDKIDKEIENIIENRTKQWGLHVSSVEIRDVLIPNELQDAMSMQAQAERERQARIILGDSEKQVANKFEEAAKTYQNNPTALHLRAMNILYEGLKANTTFVLVPASILDTMSLGVNLDMLKAGVSVVPGIMEVKKDDKTSEASKNNSKQES